MKLERIAFHFYQGQDGPYWFLKFELLKNNSESSFTLTRTIELTKLDLGYEAILTPFCVLPLM